MAGRMPPIRDRAALSHLRAVSAAARARELYEYYQPSTTSDPPDDGNDRSHDDTEVNVTADSVSSKTSSPDTALTAFCQLVTWRMGSQRSLLSLIDDATQYFIAESTRTVDLVDSFSHAPGDNLWIGCGSASKTAGLCERTIGVTPPETGDYPSFIVNDLSKDDRFNQMPFVTGPPFLRFYAGVPLITKRGIPIGSLCIIDQRVRDGLNKDEIHFMGTMSDTVMKHLELVKDVEEHRRGTKMSSGLASFVEGRAELEAEVDTGSEEGNKVAGQFESDPWLQRTTSKSASTPGSIISAVGSVGSTEHKEREYLGTTLKTENDSLSPFDGPPRYTTPDFGQQVHSFVETHQSFSSPAADLPETPQDKFEASTMKSVFARAANLIKEAFEVEGCVFYDAQKGFNLQNKPPLSRQTSQMDSGDSSLSPADNCLGCDNKSPLQLDPGSSGAGDGGFSMSSTESKRAVEVLGFSTATGSSYHGDECHTPGPGPQSFTPLHEKALHTLLRRYPRGKLWTLDSDVAVSPSPENGVFSVNGNLDQHRKDTTKSNAKDDKANPDADFLSKHFPGVHQLIFVPLWDCGRSRWLSACCVWSTEPTRILTKRNELAFLTAFGNSVMAECSRIETEIADQKKSDFIGSISHELRSPLHGILASAEFLGEERLSSFVKGLVDTIDSCGRTLLDTINHILDFSKINHFEKTWLKTKRLGRTRSESELEGPLALQKSEIPMMNLFAEVDISAICEEVVESVTAGHIFANMTAQSFDMVPGAQRKMSDSKGHISNTTVGSDQTIRPQVSVVLDIDAQNYIFVTQPGAFRRIVMNLLGNALKYTSQGYVRVTLETADTDPSVTGTISRPLVTLTVTDTGKGISSEFLRSKLFTPFAQENSLSSGTGLGLSIVKSIVSLLEGEIAIDSEVGRGTKVKVTLPLLREIPNFPISGSNPRSATALPREVDESVPTLRARVVGSTVSLHGFDFDTPDPLLRQLGKLLECSITTFLTKWYGLRIVLMNQNPDIIIVNEIGPSTITSAIGENRWNWKSPTILVLCSHSSRFDRTFTPTTSTQNMGFVAKPVGPLKLARALLQCLEGLPPVITPRPMEQPSSIRNTDLSGAFEELSVSPRGGEVLDNSRMAADNSNARKAIGSSTPSVAAEKYMEFPFPVGTTRAGSPVDQRASPSTASTDIKASTNTHSPIPEAWPKPRLLLVDDNKINLTLLRTYMRRRNYEIIDEADNGLDAVARFNERPEGYDIIFMDISMPILDGFGATRQIRTIESSRRESVAEAQPDNLERARSGGKDKEPDEEPATALVVALTGLASTRDQNEALTSGIDLFLTKPVAFREVGKMLDNWEANHRSGDQSSAAGRR